MYHQKGLLVEEGRFLFLNNSQKGHKVTKVNFGETHMRKTPLHGFDIFVVLRCLNKTSVLNCDMRTSYYVLPTRYFV